MEEKEVAFIGKITSGVTHEINNVLASIKEISGLLEDILSLSHADSFPHQEKFRNSLPKIKEQVQRGIKLTAQLNKFSHLPDNKICSTDLNDLTDHFIFLNQRFAGLKNVALEDQPSDQQITIETNPLLLQMALFCSTQYFLKIMESGGKIIISPFRNEDENIININCEGNVSDKELIFKDTDSSEELLLLREIIQSLNAKLEINESVPGIKLILTEN